MSSLSVGVLGRARRYGRRDAPGSRLTLKFERASPEPREAAAWDDAPVARTVLIVDDHADFRGFARRVLQADGYEVVGEAGDGASAIAAAEALAPDVVLLDVQLPDGDGFSVCERIAGAAAVVMTSSRDAASLQGRLEASSARGFIAKAELSGAGIAALTAPA
jgi:CheY-like chemotaxis protein